ncbi:ankyrin repeat protein, putative [Trichomonas vaginalis G3]|uniref:Ankyrin repeat protein, putative n=1 Tax=Trichomonas vaginalis (strain ATCC PRA-98 / G3) TaxID=412133 RepID=A2DV40_TRIV3|nr:spectrin binding [Trichomonas vaginalis G3]EAY15767.1 ankyrin repeat protein, putative [Trichomonas vaginalis G3]KAI5486540.1 spectrin binding [Trichomonas vaginalis G3]|eukprot:XP_001327990.1 ankyrin repeat protein [Trichomonas vaginalis G3]
MILEASRESNLCLVKHLFNYGADIRSKNNYNRTILHFFCYRGNLEWVKFALKFLDINAKDDAVMTPIHKAIHYNNVDVCEYLSTQPNIDKCAKNSENETPLQFALRLNREPIVEILRRNGFIE